VKGENRKYIDSISKRFFEWTARNRGDGDWRLTGFLKSLLRQVAFAFVFSKWPRLKIVN